MQKSRFLQCHNFSRISRIRPHQLIQKKSIFVNFCMIKLRLSIEHYFYKRITRSLYTFRFYPYQDIPLLQAVCRQQFVSVLHSDYHCAYRIFLRRIINGLRRNLHTGKGNLILIANPPERLRHQIELFLAVISAQYHCL